MVPCSLEQGSYGKAFEVALAAAAAVAGFGSSGGHKDVCDEVGC